MKSTMLGLMLGLLLSSGCVSQRGYLAVADFDFRKPEQIEASIREIEAPYKDWSAANKQEPKVNEEVRKESISIEA